MSLLPPFARCSGQYWDRVLLCLLGFVLLAILRISTNHAARHLMALSALFIFFLALAACIGGIFIGQASSWKPEAITPDLPSPSLKYLRENLLLSEVTTCTGYLPSALA